MDGKISVLLMNVGTPQSPDAADVRRFLREFLSDRRVVDVNRALWWFVLNGIILNTRPKKVAKLYQSIWTDKGSPILTIGQSLADRLGEVLTKKLAVEVDVRPAMTYGRPSVSDGIREAISSGASRIVVLPLFPQYSGTTTGAAFDAVGRALKFERDIPHLTYIRGYWNHPSYIGALKESLTGFWKSGSLPDELLISYHGLPVRYVEAGDPYAEQCEETTQLLTKALNHKVKRIRMSYQSRFGREPWLTPYTDEELASLGKNGPESLDVLCPGFAVDCLETLHEIAIDGAEIFTAAGGKRLRYIPALNDSSEHAEALADITASHLASSFGK